MSAKPRVLILHNRYRQRGGEDVVAESQARLLREYGHEVRVFERDNREIDSYGLLRKFALFFQTSENSNSAAEVAKIVREFRPEVAHVHNTLPLLSPAIYAPLKKGGAKIIQWIHNYRLVCPAGTLFRDGKPCTLCVDDGLRHSVKHRCWNNSTLATLAATRMLDRHRRARTWHTHVNLFVAINSHLRDTLAGKGVVPEDKITVEPNFAHVDDVLPPRTDKTNREDYFVFAGRLTPEKGVRTLLKAWEGLPDLKLQIVGGGPLAEEVKRAAGRNVIYAGELPRAEALARIRDSRALIFASEWPEGALTIIEALALGKPVVASRTAGALELLRENETGVFFEPGNAGQLQQAVRSLSENSALCAQMSQNARSRYEAAHSPESGYRRIQRIYERLELAPAAK